jgi:phosphopantetheine adenylyltransferase
VNTVEEGIILLILNTMNLKMTSVKTLFLMVSALIQYVGSGCMRTAYSEGDTKLKDYSIQNVINNKKTIKNKKFVPVLHVILICIAFIN